MKLDLCKIFGVKEKQHFWTKEHDDRIYEYFVSNNKLYIETKDLTTEILCFNLMEVKEIYYKKPIQLQLTENTKQFLKLINKDFKYITRGKDTSIDIYKNKPQKCEDKIGWTSNGCYGVSWFDISEYEIFLDIDLSFIKWNDEKPYSITDLLGDEE